MRILVVGVTVALAAGVANAHELWCEKTVNGQELIEVRSYPTTLTYHVEVRNTHPTDVSVIESSSDDPTYVDLGLPISLPVNQDITYVYHVTVSSYEDCARLADDPSYLQNEESILYSWTTIGWDLGSTMCLAEVICDNPATLPPANPPTRTLGFYKTHESALAQCLRGGGMDLGFVTVNNLQEALGMLWGSPEQFDDGTPRTDLEKQRFLLGRQLLVGFCNSQFGAVPSPQSLFYDAYQEARTANCRGIADFTAKLDAFNNSGDSQPLPAGYDPGPATPSHAQSIADDPTTPTGEVCQ